MAEAGIKEYFGDAVTDSSTTAKHGLGVLRFEGANIYRYVQVVDKAVTLGDVVCAASTADGIVTADRSGGSQVALMARGVAVGSIASASYGWIIKEGYAVVQCDGSVGAGEGLTPHVSADGHADTVVAASDATGTEYQVFGFATAADAGSSDGDTATALISCK